MSVELGIVNSVGKMSQWLSLSQEDSFAKQRAFRFVQANTERARLDKRSYADVSLWLLARRRRCPGDLL